MSVTVAEAAGCAGSAPPRWGRPARPSRRPRPAGLCCARLDELGDGADASPGQFGEEDHALYVVVLQQRHIRPHLGDALDLARRAGGSAVCWGDRTAQGARGRPPVGHRAPGSGPPAAARGRRCHTRLDHDHVIHLRIALLVHAAVAGRHGCWRWLSSAQCLRSSSASPTLTHASVLPPTRASQPLQLHKERGGGGGVQCAWVRFSAARFVPGFRKFL